MVSELWARVRGGNSPVGGIVSYPLKRLQEEVAFIARDLGWSHDDILSLTHLERARWIQTINGIHEQHNR
jgi:hypothetical protein